MVAEHVVSHRRVRLLGLIFFVDPSVGGIVLSCLVALMAIHLVHYSSNLQIQLLLVHFSIGRCIAQWLIPALLEH